MTDNFFIGLINSKDIAFWPAGIAIAIAWLSGGRTLLRLATLGIAIFWPAAVIIPAVIQQHGMQRAAEDFSSLCAKSAFEKIHEYAGPADEIFVEYLPRPTTPAAFAIGNTSLHYLTNSLGAEIASRLTLERPGYQKIYNVSRNSAGDMVIRPFKRTDADSNLNNPSPMPAGKTKLPRFGVELGPLHQQDNPFVSQFSVKVVDRKNNALIAEQRNYFYESPGIEVFGYPLWRAQIHSCSLAHPADFVRSAIQPKAE